MSYISNLVHFVWGAANREPLIDKSWRDRLHGYMGGILENKKAKLLAAGGVADHVHVLASLPATISLAETAGALKANSSRWIHDNAPQCAAFAWQEGYGAFSVSKSMEPTVKAYIKNQEEHHRQRSFREEFVMLLEKHGIAYLDSATFISDSTRMGLRSLNLRPIGMQSFQKPSLFTLNRCSVNTSRS